MKIRAALETLWLYSISETCFAASTDSSMPNDIYIISWPIYFRILGYYRAKMLRMSRNMNMHQKLAVYSNRVIRILSCLKYGKASPQYMVATPKQKAKVGKYIAKNAININFLIKLSSKESECISLIFQYLQACFLNNIFHFSKVQDISWHVWH